MGRLRALLRIGRMACLAGLALPAIAGSALAQFSPLPANPRERDWFRMPQEEDFRFQQIARGPNETNWPFTEDSGLVSCAFVMGQPIVTFFPDSVVNCDCDEDTAEEGVPRHLTLSINPFDLVFLNIANRELLAPTSGVEELIERIAPYYVIGRRLCDQPRGSQLGPGEL
jgi:hypothetical protein